MSTGDLASRLESQDPVLLGGRLRDARRRAHLAQGDVARAVGVSVSYVSRIEAGKRRCDLDLLTGLAASLRTSVDALLTEHSSGADPQVRAGRPDELEFALVALEMGEAQTALDLLLAIDPEEAAPTVVREAALLRGRALEGLGRLVDAIEVLEEIALPGPDPLADVPVAITMSRVYRESGETARAVRVGESALEALAAIGLEGGDEGVQLAVTVAAAYFEQGDRAYALRLCRRTLALAERTGTPRARASAYWNCAIIDHERGNTESAVRMARRALALLGEGQDERHLGYLRTELGLMELQSTPPDLEQAHHHLSEARRLLEGSSGGEVDLLRVAYGFARLQLLAGDPRAAREEALLILERLAGEAPQLGAHAVSLAGEASVSLGEPERARELLLQAVNLLTGIDDARSVAQLWFDLGGRLLAVGDTAAAADAFQRAAVAAGLVPNGTAPASLEARANPPHV